MRILRFVPLAALVLGLLLMAPGAEAQLASAELYVNVDAGVSASDFEHPLVSDSFSDGPRSDDIFLGSGTIPWNLHVTSGGGDASTSGQIVYLAATSQLFSTGNFTMHAAAGEDASALAGFDAVISIAFQVAVQTTFTIGGYVSASRDLAASEVISCQYNGVILAGDTRATPLPAGVYGIDVERTLYPGETGTLQCSAASSGGQSDTSTLAWDVAIEGLPEPDAAFGSLASVGVLAVLTRRRPRRR